MKPLFLLPRCKFTAAVPTVTLILVLVAAPARGQNSKTKPADAASSSPSPSPIPADWHAAYQSANDAASKWRDRAQELEKENQALRNQVEAATRAVSATAINQGNLTQNIAKLMDVDKTLATKMENREHLWTQGALRKSLSPTGN